MRGRGAVQTDHTFFSININLDCAQIRVFDETGRNRRGDRRILSVEIQAVGGTLCRDFRLRSPLAKGSTGGLDGRFCGIFDVDCSLLSSRAFFILCALRVGLLTMSDSLLSAY